MDAQKLAEPSFLPAIFFGSAAFVFLNFALPIYADDLGVGALGIGAMYTVFTGTMLILRPIVGWLLDRFGRRWFFTGAFCFYALAMFAFANSIDVNDFYLARFLQGIGASLMWVSARTIIADVAAAHQRGEAMGRLTAVSVRGSMLGATYGFALLSFMPMASAWFWAFVGYAFAAALGLLWSLWRVGESRPSVLAAPTANNQLPKLQLSRDLRRLLVVIGLSAFASAMIEPIYLLFLKQRFDLNIMSLALAFFPAGIVFAIVPPIAGRWADRWGRSRMMVAGIACAGLVSSSLPWLPNVLTLAVMYMFFAFAWAVAEPAEDAMVSDLATAANRGRVMGAREAAAGIGAAIGPLVGGFIYDHLAHWVAFIANGVLLGCAALLVLLWFPHSSAAKAQVH